jgi:hypothetical protein
MSKNTVCYTIIGICLLSAACLAKYSGGTGEPNDPYLIATPNDLCALADDTNDYDKNFLMVNDINMASITGSQFNIIGNSTNPFTGLFDGSGYSIQNFTWHANDVDYIGLFGYCGTSQNTATLKNIILINPIVHASPRDNIGSLIGYSYGGYVQNCRVVNGTVSGGLNVGGLAGHIVSSQVYSCQADGIVEGIGSVGGLVGRGRSIHTLQCKSTGMVTATGEKAGGLIGVAHSISDVNSCFSEVNVVGSSKIGGLIGALEYDSDVYNCYASGSVTGYYQCGGFIGYVYEFMSGNIDNKVINCYSTGLVTGGPDYVEPFIGYRYGWTIIKYCYWNSETSGFSKGTWGWPKTTDQMQSVETYFLWGLTSPGLWRIDDGSDYPRLLWENTPGIVIEAPQFTGGSGEGNDPYLISTPQQLNLLGAVKDLWNQYFKLIADLDMSCFSYGEFDNIGYYLDCFSGIFDGNGHTVFNYHDKRGLFGQVGDSGTIRNLRLDDSQVGYDVAEILGLLVDRLEDGFIYNCIITDCNVFGKRVVGGLVGYNHAGTVKNCEVSGVVTGDRELTGGITGSNQGEILNCRARVQMYGFSDVGGIAGFNYTVIKNCSVDSSLISGHDFVGGIAGKSNGTMFNCSSSVDIVLTSTFINTAGGLVGYNTGIIKNCSSFGTVEGIGRLGGLVGENRDTILSSFSESRVVNLNDFGRIGGLVGINGDDALVADSWALGNIGGPFYSGGLIGRNSGTISRCYVSGIANGDGAFIGYQDSFTSIDGFWDKTLNPTKKSIGNYPDSSFPEILGLSTTEMQTSTTFIDAGWDFVGETSNGSNYIWTIHEGQDYPKLVWNLVNFDSWYNVDFADFAYFTNRWMDSNCAATSDCGGTDLDFSGAVDSLDLKIFCAHWLEDM